MPSAARRTDDHSYGDSYGTSNTIPEWVVDDVQPASEVLPSEAHPVSLSASTSAAPESLTRTAREWNPGPRESSPLAEIFQRAAGLGGTADECLLLNHGIIFPPSPFGDNGINAIRRNLQQALIYLINEPLDPTAHVKTFAVLATRERMCTALQVMRIPAATARTKNMEPYAGLVSAAPGAFTTAPARRPGDFQFVPQLGCECHPDVFIDLEVPWMLNNVMNAMLCGRISPDALKAIVQEHVDRYFSPLEYLLPRSEEPKRKVLMR